MKNNAHKSPEHDRWHRIVEGQIKDCARQHPEYFSNSTFEACLNSLAKRIVGEIVNGLSSR